jgi:hypothetical protein
MKILLFIFSLTMMMTAFAEESQTECSMMKDQTVRNNPKAQLDNVKIKDNKKNKVNAQ